MDRSRWATRGLRERLVPRTSAPGMPFDHGTFAAREEPLDAPDVALPAAQLVQLRREPLL